MLWFLYPICKIKIELVNLRLLRRLPDSVSSVASLKKVTTDQQSICWSHLDLYNRDKYYYL